MTKHPASIVEILAFLASRDPEGFAALVKPHERHFPIGDNPVFLAEDVIDAVSIGIGASEETQIATDFEKHLLFVGKSARRAERRAGFIRWALLTLGVDVVDKAALGEQFSLDAFSDFAGRHADESPERIIETWSAFRSDREALGREFAEVGYKSVGESTPALEFAALTAGCLRSWGRSDDGSFIPPNLVLADLPFSTFVNAASDVDPAITEVLSKLSHHRDTPAFLLRMDWTVGDRLRLKAKDYEALVSKALPGHEIRSIVIDSDRCVPMRGKDLFIGAARKWTGEFRAVSLGRTVEKGTWILEDVAVDEGYAVPADAVGRRFLTEGADRIYSDYAADPSAALVPNGQDGKLRRLTPGEIAKLLGFGPAYLLRASDQASAYSLLGRSVALPVAQRALRGLLRAVDLV